ncbi:alpha/beta fold hydrolase [Aliamphritea hakodatensis]|uniref:alpha/beta fold hydrolase n=1 Tax=Aliamphritea hakodatensis TaxID=2895352 RepID=UPI0022FD9042|nr:alpha/beta hydrolase [Aliamphritea hakodatensis]
MRITVNQQDVFIATGGKDFNPELPCVVFLHGSGLDHRCWALQARWFAFHGYSVFAPDFPGHSLSAGEPLTSIEAMADWLIDALDAAGVDQLHLVGHSQGFLVALEAAARLQSKLLSLTAIGTAAAIPVNPALIETAKEAPMKAADMMLQWGFGQATQMGYSAVPGVQPIAVGRQIMAANPLAEDLQACNDYTQGTVRAADIMCPTQVILAGQDRMTPYKTGLELAKLLNTEAIRIESGHMLPIEAPKACLDAMKQFFTRL